MKLRPILHVHIKDDTGKLLADVDAASTADGLAYYLASRGIDHRATEDIIRKAAGGSVQGSPGRHVSDREPIVFEKRHPITNVIERQILAEVGR